MIDDVTLPGEASITTESATPKPSVDEKKQAADEAILALARKEFKTSLSAEDHFRTEAVDDAKFSAGTWGTISYQWPSGVQEQRRIDGRPCLTINRQPGFKRQVTNQARQANLRITVVPVDDKGDPKLAEVLQGIIRNIETQSFADRAYNCASDKQAEQGRGAFRLITEWADEKGFRQRIRIERETNPLSIYWDPASRRADFSDGLYAFKVTDIDRAVFKDVTGQEPPEASTLEGFSGGGDETGDWFPNGKIRFVEYFKREARGPKTQLAQLSDGRVFPNLTPEQRAGLERLGIRILRERTVQPKVTVWRKMDALRIHEETIWPADTSPFIPVLGDEYEIEGVRDYRGVTRDSKDSARVYNVQVTSLVEQVGMGQKAPVVGYRGQFGAQNSPQRKAWETANQKPHAFLEVEPVDIDGKNAPLPQRVNFEPPLQGTIMAIHQADEDYKSTAGFRDASLGERGPQESGKAILARQRQDELGSSHYLDNLRFALASAGRQLIQLIRVVYDEPTVLRITGSDDRQRKVMVFSGAHNDPRHARFQQAGKPFALPEGVGPNDLYDLSVGEFDVEVNAGPNPGSRRQEELQQLVEIFKSLPPEVSVKFLDLEFALFDTAIGRQMMERAKKLLPPELQDDGEDGKPTLDQVQARFHQLKALFEKLQQAYQIAKQELATEKTKTDAALKKTQMETESRERQTAMTTDAALATTQAKIDAQKAEANIERMEARIGEVIGLVHEERLAREAQVHELRVLGHEHGHALVTAAADHARSLEAGAVQQQQTLEQGQAGHAQALEQGQQAADLAPPPATGGTE